MAAGHSDYNRGDMPIEAQSKTFSGFMVGTIYGGAFIAVVLLFPILFFGANFSWMTSLVSTLVVGILIGLALKLKGIWYATLVIMAVITAIFCLIFA